MRGRGVQGGAAEVRERAGERERDNAKIFGDGQYQLKGSTLMRKNDERMMNE